MVRVLRAEGPKKPKRGVIALPDVRFALEAGADYAWCGGERAGESISLAVHTRIYRLGTGKSGCGGRRVERRGSVDTRASGLALIEASSSPASQLSAVGNVFPAASRPAGWPGSTFSRSG